MRTDCGALAEVIGSSKGKGDPALLRARLRAPQGDYRK